MIQEKHITLPVDQPCDRIMKDPDCWLWNSGLVTKPWEKLCLFSPLKNSIKVGPTGKNWED